METQMRVISATGGGERIGTLVRVTKTQAILSFKRSHGGGSYTERYGMLEWRRMGDTWGSGWRVVKEDRHLALEARARAYPELTPASPSIDTSTASSHSTAGSDQEPGSVGR